MISHLRLPSLWLIAWLLVACRPSSPPSGSVSGGDLVFTFAQAGVYRLSPERAPAALQDGEQSVPLWQAQTLDGPLTFFYAPVTATRSSSLDALFYKPRTPTVLVSPAPLTPLSAPNAQTTTTASLWWEQDLLYQSRAELPLPWLWARLIAPTSWQNEITLPTTASVPFTLTVRVWGQTAMPVDPDHHLQILWDGEVVGDESWEGAGVHTLTIPLVAGASGHHTLTLVAPGDTGATAEVLFLDGWGIAYQRPLDLRAEPVSWLATAPAAWIQVSAGEPIWLLDITDPLAPVAFGPAQTDASAITLATQPGHHYWAGTAAQMPVPPRQRPSGHLSPTELRTLATADEVIVGAKAFLQAAHPLVAYRQSTGLSVATLTPTQLIDHWGRGVPDASALPQFLAWRRGQGQLPSYVLLLGDAELAPWQGDTTILAERIPTAFVATPYIGETPSDVALLGDAAGDVGLGRIPAHSPDEVAAVVKKILAYEQSDKSRRHLILNDDDAEFTAFAVAIADFWQQQGDTVRHFTVAMPSARTALLDALQQGPAWLHYVGHGSPLLWSKAQILTAADASRWQTPSFVFAWTCLSGYFILSDKQSLAEQWLLAPQGGAIAVIAPTGEDVTPRQQQFADTFYRLLASSDTLGLALARTRAELGPDEIVWQYQLFGDPALRMDR